MKQVDQYGNPIQVGDMIIYDGSTVGLIMGIVVKLSPKSYKVKYKYKMWDGRIVDKYLNIAFEYKDSILTMKSVMDFDPISLLSDIEKRRMEE